MRIDRTALAWGLFFILVGAIPLAVRAGYLSAAQVGDLWRFWPLLVIAIGLGIMLRRTPLEGLSGLVTAAFFGILVGGLFAGSGSDFGAFPSIGCNDRAGTRPFATQSGTIAGPGGTVQLTLDCGAAAVTTQAGTGWQVSGSDTDGAGPIVEADVDSVSVRSRDDRGPFSWSSSREDWQVSLPRAARFDLEVELNAGSSTFDLTGANLGTVDLQMNAGSTTLDLSKVESAERLAIEVNAGSVGIDLPATGTTGSIQVNAGSVELCAPTGVGLRLDTGENIISSYDYAGHGLIQNGSVWETPGYEAAAVKLDLTTEANAGSFKLDPADGCHG